MSEPQGDQECHWRNDQECRRRVREGTRVKACTYACAPLVRLRACTCANVRARTRAYVRALTRRLAAHLHTCTRTRTRTHTHTRTHIHTHTQNEPFPQGFHRGAEELELILKDLSLYIYKKNIYMYIYIYSLFFLQTNNCVESLVKKSQAPVKTQI